MVPKTLTIKKPSKITVLLDTDEFGRFDAYCDAQGFKKSTLIARLIREHLDTEKFGMQQKLAISAANAER
jgi:hypothetical protein